MHLFFVTLFLVISSAVTQSTEVLFNRNFTGVAFSAYVRNDFGDFITDWKLYSLQHVETMIEVISSRFSKIATFGAGAPDGTLKIPNANFK